jgi:hypothetical protein
MVAGRQQRATPPASTVRRPTDWSRPRRPRAALRRSIALRSECTHAAASSRCAISRRIAPTPLDDDQAGRQPVARWRPGGRAYHKRVVGRPRPALRVSASAPRPRGGPRAGSDGDDREDEKQSCWLGPRPTPARARWTSADGRRLADPVARPTAILAFSVLRAAAAATAVADSAGQQQDYDDDEKDREHGHLPRLGWVGSRIRASIA